MLFGMRFDLRNPDFAGVAMADRYAAVLDMAQWADEHGGLYLSFQEHHGAEDSYLPSPLTMASAVASRTNRLVINIAALIAPFYDPLRLAEDIAVVDQISRGRLALIVAGGYALHEFEMFGVSPSERVARVTETVTTLRQAWTGEPFEFRGRTVRVTPTPFQPGGPKILMGGSSEGAARRAARLGDGFTPSEPRFHEHYRDECLKLGKPDPGPAMVTDNVNLFLSEDPERTWEQLAPYFFHETNGYGGWKVSAGVASPYTPVSSMEELRNCGYYRVVTPDEFATAMEPLGEMAMARMHPMLGGIPPELAWENLRLFEKHFC